MWGANKRENFQRQNINTIFRLPSNKFKSAPGFLRNSVAQNLSIHISGRYTTWWANKGFRLEYAALKSSVLIDHIHTDFAVSHGGTWTVMLVFPALQICAISELHIFKHAQVPKIQWYFSWPFIASSYSNDILSKDYPENRELFQRKHCSQHAILSSCRVKIWRRNFLDCIVLLVHRVHHGFTISFVS